jgi:alkanesulfonate monooxygenase SsuD/methylene tetrahydromethanopterin reductase-like flavin-dependent oxidoreductase (luciferase family)
MKRFLEGRERMLKYTPAEMVAAGGAVIGSPETCRRMLQGFADSGVDEVMLFMQCATTPHEALMESIRLMGSEVIPALS